MKDFFVLQLLDSFSRIFEKFGVDYRAMRKILQVKLTLDGRRVPTIFQQRNQSQKQKKERNVFISSLLFYAIFSLFFIPFIVMGDNYLFQMSLVFGMIMFFVMTAMISDFSSVLLDLRDKSILQSKPINQKTINMAKTIHIIIYLIYLTGSLAGIPLVVGLFKHGIGFFLISLFNLIFLSLFIVVFTALIYLAILKFFDGEKLKDIINYVQIGLSLSILIGYQLLIRSFELIDLTIVIHVEWWHVAIVPMWFASIYESVLNGNWQSILIVFSLLAVIMPILSFYIYLHMAPVFERNLEKLSTTTVQKGKRKNTINKKLTRILCRNPLEASFFRFASLMMKSERDFKLKVYPSLGFSIIVPFIFIINQRMMLDFADIFDSKWYLSIYFSMLIIPTVVLMLRYSGKYKGAWIYKAAPLTDLRYVFSGTIKAFLVKLYLPLYSFISIIFVYLFRFKIIPDLIVIFLTSCVYTVICFLLLKKSLPFSESFTAASQNDNLKAVLLFLIVPLFWLLHYMSTFVEYGVYLYMLAVLIVLVSIWHVSLKVSWEQVQRES
ncbi:hypothetical protein [Bacillus kwashiorkori]|uniref:hypothetical protein n=1 Tax=Bacillus kwashiorkori TaxID=1522318 RepID=UPI00078632A6|nr:hypothetical protein [Bacillus kwashiorkori]